MSFNYTVSFLFVPAAAMGSPGERKISFAVNAERSDSIHSSTTSISLDPMNPPHTPVEERKGKAILFLEFIIPLNQHPRVA